MEHAQRAEYKDSTTYDLDGLNPYFNGTCSKRMEKTSMKPVTVWVLILILMEHAQRVLSLYKTVALTRLNPYFNGTCSKRK